jgi:hypothetical protein
MKFKIPQGNATEVYAVTYEYSRSGQGFEIMRIFRDYDKAIEYMEEAKKNKDTDAYWEDWNIEQCELEE